MNNKFVMCLGSVLVMVRAEGGHDTTAGDGEPVAEPLMGSISLPSFPHSFPLTEFTNYGINSHLMPSGSAQGGRERPYGMAGSVPVNAYHNPTSGLRYPQPPTTFQASGGLAGVGEEVQLAGYPGGGAALGGYGGAAVTRLDPVDYSDYRDEAQAQEGTLEAALHTLWSHRNDVYSSLEEMGTAAVNHAWLDILGLHQPRPASGSRPTHTPHDYNPPGQESSHPPEVPTRNVGSVYLPTTLKPGGYDLSQRLPSGQSQHTVFMGGRRTSPIHHQKVLGEHTRSPVGPRLPVRTVGDRNDMVGVRPVTRPEVGNKRMPLIPAGGSSGMFGLRSPPGGNQRPDWRHRPRGSKHRIQIVRQQLPVGRVGFSAPEKGSSQPTAFLATSSSQADYQNFATASRTSPMNSPHLGMVTSNVLLGQHDHQAHAENTQTGLTLAEVMELAKIMDLPLEKKLFLEKDSNSDLGNAISILQQQKDGNWLSQIGQVVSGVSQQLPSIDQAVTTMSFLAFGIFMANLVVQAIANSSSLSSLLGREDVGSFTWLPFDFSTFPPDLRSLEMDLSLGEDDVDNGMLKNVVEVISQVYISLHEMARAGVSQIVSAVGVGVPKSRISPGIADLEPECLHRLLCEGHHVTSPFFQDMSYRLLPFWTMGVSWLSGESSVPKLLEELRAEVAGQQGLDCASLFPECLDTGSIETFLTQVESEMAYNPGLVTEDLIIETGEARTTGVEVRYTKQQNINATDDSLRNSVPKSLIDTHERFPLPSQDGHDKDKSNRNGMLSEGSGTGQIT